MGGEAVAVVKEATDGDEATGGGSGAASGLKTAAGGEYDSSIGIRACRAGEYALQPPPI